MNSEIYKFVFKMMEAFDKAEKAMEDDEFKVNLEKFVNACVKKVIWSKNLFSCLLQNLEIDFELGSSSSSVHWKLGKFLYRVPDGNSKTGC